MDKFDSEVFGLIYYFIVVFYLAWAYWHYLRPWLKKHQKEKKNDHVLEE